VCEEDIDTKRSSTGKSCVRGDSRATRKSTPSIHCFQKVGSWRRLMVFWAVLGGRIAAIDTREFSLILRAPRRPRAFLANYRPSVPEIEVVDRVPTTKWGWLMYGTPVISSGGLRMWHMLCLPDQAWPVYVLRAILA